MERRSATVRVASTVHVALGLAFAIATPMVLAYDARQGELPMTPLRVPAPEWSIPECRYGRVDAARQGARLDARRELCSRRGRRNLAAGGAPTRRRPGACHSALVLRARCCVRAARPAHRRAPPDIPPDHGLAASPLTDEGTGAPNPVSVMIAADGGVRRWHRSDTFSGLDRE